MMVVESKLDKIRNAKKKFEGLKKSLSQQIMQDVEEDFLKVAAPARAPPASRGGAAAGTRLFL